MSLSAQFIFLLSEIVLKPVCPGKPRTSKAGIFRMQEPRIVGANTLGRGWGCRWHLEVKSEKGEVKMQHFYRRPTKRRV